MHQLINYKQSALKLGVSVGTLYAWVSLEKVPHVRFGNRNVRFDEKELDTWISSKKVTSKDVSPPISQSNDAK